VDTDESGWHDKKARINSYMVLVQELTFPGTPHYMAPEIISKGKFSEKTDVYSFGTFPFFKPLFLLLDLLSKRC
jgi:serine/threonine protein kinase